MTFFTDFTKVTLAIRSEVMLSASRSYRALLTKKVPRPLVFVFCFLFTFTLHSGHWRLTKVCEELLVPFLKGSKRAIEVVLLVQMDNNRLVRIVSE